MHSRTVPGMRRKNRDMYMCESDRFFSSFVFFYICVSRFAMNKQTLSTEKKKKSFCLSLIVKEINTFFIHKTIIIIRSLYLLLFFFLVSYITFENRSIAA